MLGNLSANSSLSVVFSLAKAHRQNHTSIVHCLKCERVANSEQIRPYGQPFQLFVNGSHIIANDYLRNNGIEEGSVILTEGNCHISTTERHLELSDVLSQLKFKGTSSGSSIRSYRGIAEAFPNANIRVGGKGISRYSLGRQCALVSVQSLKTVDDRIHATTRLGEEVNLYNSSRNNYKESIKELILPVKRPTSQDDVGDVILISFGSRTKQGNYLGTCEGILLNEDGSENKAIGIKTGGKEALRDGKSLFLSGHVKEAKYHGISCNIAYCFVKAKVVRETTVSAAPYSSWVILHKQNDTVCDAFCSCPAGVRGSCKHVAGICHHIIAKIGRGENVSVTSREQAWDLPSGKHQHEPDFLRNIKIKKIKGNCQLEGKAAKGNRFDFDPRAMEDRRVKRIEDLDLEGLRKASDSKAAILKFFPQEHPVWQESPDLSAVAIVMEETVTAIEEEPLPPTIPEIAKQCGSADEIVEAVSKPLSFDDIKRISEATVQQSNNELWFSVRTGRITASKLKNCADKVDLEGGKIRGETTSYVKQIMNYYPKAHSPAINWGIYNEPHAIADFLKAQRGFHKHMKVKPCGVFVCGQYPFIAASPDAIVTCDCCGDRPLEVKNPFKYRHMSIQNYAAQKDSCLEILENGTISLKYDHTYYTQVQLQILAAGADAGYFCVRMAAPECSLHCQEVYMNTDFLEEAVAKAEVFFRLVVVPELITGNVKKAMQDMPATATSHADDSTEKTQPDFPCGKCGLECPEEPNEFNEMSVGCDGCNLWFHWQCVNLTGKEAFLEEKNVTWMCGSCSSTPSQ